MNTSYTLPAKNNPDRLQNILLFIAIGLFLPLFVFHCVGYWKLLSFPGEINFGEGLQNVESRRVGNLAELYGDISKPPYWALTYPPVYHFLTEYVGFGSLLGQRIISLVSSVGQWVVMILILRRITGSYLPGVLAALMFIDSVFVAPWAVIGRTDMTGRFFSTVAIGTAFLLRDYRKAFACALVFSTLAVLTKQTMFTGGMVSALILWQRNRKYGLLYAGVLGFATVGSYLLLNLITHGGFFRHAFTYTARGLDGALLRFWSLSFLEVHWHYMLSAVAGLYVIYRFDRKLWWLAAALIPSLVNAIAIANPGGDRNYFFDLVWTLAMLTAVGFWHYSKQFSVTRKTVPSGTIVFIIMGALMLSNAYAGIQARMVYPDASFVARANDVINELRKTPGPNLVEYAGYGVAAGQTSEYPAYIMKALEKRRLFDPKPILDNISQKKYQTILVSNAVYDRYSQEFITTVQTYYHVDRVIKYNYFTEGPIDLYFMHPKAEPEKGSEISSNTQSQNLITSTTPSS